MVNSRSGISLTSGLVRNLDQSSNSFATTAARLSSGLRINKASDDPAGLAVSAKLDTNSRLYTKAIANANDGISLLSIAQSALEELSTISTRQLELAQQAANGALTFIQRKALNEEANQLQDEYNRIVSSTKFNGIQVLNNYGKINFQLGTDSNGVVGINSGQELARQLGLGTFQNPTAVGSPGGYNNIVSHDLNGDGILDLVAADDLLSTVKVMILNASGSVTNEYSYNTGDFPFGVTLGDFNGDGNADIATANYQDITASILLGNGNGTFTSAGSIFGLSAPGSIVSMDFNSDGFDDLAVLEDSTGYVVMFSSDGDGTFTERQSFYYGAGSANWMTKDDFDRDGIEDLVVATTSSHISVLRGNGDGTYKTAVTYTVGTTPRWVETGDFNGDGYRDIITADYDSNSVSILIGRGNGTFAARTSIALGASSPTSVSVGDINGDGLDDFAVNQKSTGTINFYIGNGEGSFTLSQSKTHVNADSKTSLITDINGDGIAEVFSSDVLNIQIFRQNTTTTTTAPTLSLYDIESARTAIGIVNAQLTRVNKEVAAIGSAQSRISFALSNLHSLREVTIEASSRITSADVATESANLIRSQILRESGAALLAQANQSSRLVLSLLQNSDET